MLLLLGASHRIVRSAALCMESLADSPAVGSIGVGLTARASKVVDLRSKKGWALHVPDEISKRSRGSPRAPAENRFCARSTAGQGSLNRTRTALLIALLPAHAAPKDTKALRRLPCAGVRYACTVAFVPDGAKQLRPAFELGYTVAAFLFCHI